MVSPVVEETAAMPFPAERKKRGIVGWWLFVRPEARKEEREEGGRFWLGEEEPVVARPFVVFPFSESEKRRGAAVRREKRKKGEKCGSCCCGGFTGEEREEREVGWVYCREIMEVVARRKKKERMRHGASQ
ncbi:hypothetical protein HAX54_012750, partial [Datura stramonium]|nr:hypothetical protein [Datura stramonium]